MKRTIRSIILVILGTFLVSLAINWITIPNELGDGGITGVTLFLYYTIGLNIPLTSLILNAIILMFGWRFLDKTTIIYTILSISLLSFFLANVFPAPFIPENKIVAAIARGLIMGIGLGIVLRGDGSTGGTDIIALIINKLTGISISVALLIVDLIIVLSNTFLIGLENGIITIIAIYLSSVTLNFIVVGFNPKKAVYIISDKYKEIAEDVTTVIDRGVTVFRGYGFYSKTDREILYIVVNQRQLIAVQKIVQRHDPEAFLTINEVQQVHGEGFTFVRELEQMPYEVDVPNVEDLENV